MTFRAERLRGAHLGIGRIAAFCAVLLSVWCGAGAALNASAQTLTGLSDGCTAANAGDYDFSLPVAAGLVSSPFTGSFFAGEVLTFTVTTTGVLASTAEDVTAGVVILSSLDAASEDYTVPATGSRDFNLSIHTADFIASMSVTCTGAEGSITIRKQSGSADGVFAFSGDLDGFDLSTSGGTAEQVFSGLAIGAYLIGEAINEGFTLTDISCTGDLDGGSVIDVDARQVEIDLDGDEDIICVFTNSALEDDDGVAPSDVALLSSHAIRNYLYRRASAILSEEPDRPRLIRKKPGVLWDGGLDYLNVLADGGGVDADFSASTGSLWGRRLAAWTEGHYTSYRYDDGAETTGDLGIVYFGADYLVTNNLLVGAMAQVDWASEFSAAIEKEIDGSGWMAGPYLSARLAPDLFFDLRGAWGNSTNELSIADIVSGDEFETSRWLVRGNLTGNHRMGDWRVTPSASVAYFEEQQEDYLSDGVILISGQTVSLGRATFEPEIAYRFVTPSGTLIEPQFKLGGVWDFDTPSGLSIPGWTVTPDKLRMRIEGALLVACTNGLTMRVAGTYDGIGGDGFRAYSGRIWIDIPLSPR